MALPSETLSPSLALPLRVKPSAYPKGAYWIVDQSGRKAVLAGPGEQAQRDAEQLASACNALPEITQALRDCIDSLEYVDRTHPGTSGIGVRLERIGAARHALALLEME